MASPIGLARWRALAQPRLLLWLLAPWVLWWALRDIPLADIGATLRQMGAEQMLILLSINAVVILLLSGRWWAILRALRRSVSYLTLSGYRLAGFAVSYFTPGTQFGGEPLLIDLLRRRHAIPSSTAAASVALDKALELLGNFTFLAFGVSIALRLRFFAARSGVVLSYLSFALLALPIIFLGLAWMNQRPVTGLLAKVPQGLALRVPQFARFQRFIAATEEQVSEFCRRKPLGVAAAALFSLASWAGLLGEYWLMARFLGMPLTLEQTVGLVTAGRLALLVPLPGGLGAFEASQILAAQSLGYSAAEGAGLGLLIRARDLVFGLLGLWLGVALGGKGERPTSEVADGDFRSRS
ncbi:MAG TPA: lysylphosphatidylglycerol synthase transmembrane domain-containing protein [Anaerolineales bacterium]|nr:lysylphosphatidylglycerol synthase transmembrane domain-containing protein [Anaerolineales bacterium]